MPDSKKIGDFPTQLCRIVPQDFHDLNSLKRFLEPFASIRIIFDVSDRRYTTITFENYISALCRRTYEQKYNRPASIHFA